MKTCLIKSSAGFGCYNLSYVAFLKAKFYYEFFI